MPLLDAVKFRCGVPPRLVPCVQEDPQRLHLDQDKERSAKLSLAFDEACRNGDLDHLHRLHSTWLSTQRPHPETGHVLSPFLRAASVAACENNHPACLAYILSQGLEIHDRIIKIAIELKSTELLDVLLRHGWRINEPEDAYEPAYLGRVFKNFRTDTDRSFIDWFLENGADVNASAWWWDITPLTWAVALCPLQVVQHLFDNGGSAKRGQLVYHAAQRTDADCVPILHLLAKLRAPIDETWFENIESLKYVAKQRAATTPLYEAVYVKNIESIKFLLEHGADPDKPRILPPGKGPASPYEFALQREDYGEVIESLGKYKRRKPPTFRVWTALGWT